MHSWSQCAPNPTHLINSTHFDRGLQEKHLLTICYLLSPNTLNQGVWTFSKRKRALFCCCRTSTYLLLNCGNPALFSPISLFPLLAAPPILASPSQASGGHILFARQNSFQADREPVCNLLVPPVAFWTARGIAQKETLPYVSVLTIAPWNLVRS